VPSSTSSKTSRQPRLDVKVPSTLIAIADEGDRIKMLFAAVHESVGGTFETSRLHRAMSGFGGKAENIYSF
jgi:hypothetical protein